MFKILLVNKIVQVIQNIFSIQIGICDGRSVPDEDELKVDIV